MKIRISKFELVDFCIIFNMKYLFVHDIRTKYYFNDIYIQYRNKF